MRWEVQIDSRLSMIKVGKTSLLRTYRNKPEAQIRPSTSLQSLAKSCHQPTHTKSGKIQRFRSIEHMTWFNRAISVSSSLTVLLAGAMPVLANAQQATIQEILDGDQLYIDDQKAEVRETAHSPQVISTGLSRGQISFSGGAVGRINRQSLVKLGSSCFLLNRGQILISGRQDGCTASSRLSVRGTNYVLAVSDDGSTDLAVLEGSVEVTDNDGNQQPVMVEAGQRLRLDPAGVVIGLLQLAAGDYQRILNGSLFSGYTSALPELTSLRGYLNRKLPGVRIQSVPGVQIRTTPVLPKVPSPGGFF